MPFILIVYFDNYTLISHLWLGTNILRKKKSFSNVIPNEIHVAHVYNILICN
jgi:hypothetical protein